MSTPEAQDLRPRPGLGGQLTRLVEGRLSRAISEADEEAALTRVDRLRERFPDADEEALVEMLIRQKCLQAGSVGAGTAGVGLVPVLGTLAAMTVGLAVDIGWTFKLQAELVLEIAAVYGRSLNAQQKRAIVTTITGVSTGANVVLNWAGETLARKAMERVVRRVLVKGTPAVGMAASAGANVVSTYVVGQRAKAYFSLGPKAVGDWNASVQALTGIDEQKLRGWVNETLRNSNRRLREGRHQIHRWGTQVGELAGHGAAFIAGGMRRVGRMTRRQSPEAESTSSPASDPE